MRAWLLITCCSLLCLTGCRTVQPEGSAVSHGNGDPLSREDRNLAKALAHFGQGLLYLSRDGSASAQALSELQAAAEADPTNHDLRSRIAIIALHRNTPDIAVVALETSYKHDPKAYERCVDLAAVYHATGRNELAISQYEKALKLDGSATSPYIALAALHFSANADDLARRVLNRGRELASDTELIPIYTFDQAKRFVAQGAVTRAILCFEALAEWDVDRRSQFYQLISELHLSLGDFKSAISALTRATQLPAPLPASFINLASIHLHQENKKKAIRVLNAARKRLPNAYAILVAQGRLYNAFDEYDKAIPLFQEASRCAAAKAGKGISTPPSELGEAFYLSYGGAYERSGRLEEAKQVFEAGIQQYPKSHRVLNYLAYMLAEENQDLDQALLYINAALAIENRNAAYIDTRGWIYFQQGRFKEALKEIEEASALLSNPDPEILRHLGDIHSALQNSERAATCWTQSYALDPTNETVANKLRQLGIDLDAILSDTIEKAEPLSPSNQPSE